MHQLLRRSRQESSSSESSLGHDFPPCIEYRRYSMNELSSFPMWITSHYTFIITRAAWGNSDKHMRFTR